MKHEFLEAKIVDKAECDVCIAQHRIEVEGAIPDADDPVLNKTRETGKVNICRDHHVQFMAFQTAMKHMQDKIKDMFGDR